MSPENPALFLRALQRRDFASFLRKAWSWISGGEEISWNWHLDAIAFELERVAHVANLRLLVTIPSRNGKSNGGRAHQPHVGRVHCRKSGDVLHPGGEPLHILEATRAAMGSAAFSAQYLQDPVSAVGNISKADWFRTFDPALVSRSLRERWG